MFDWVFGGAKLAWAQFSTSLAAFQADLTAFDVAGLVVLVLLTAAFSAAETALMALSEKKTQEIVDKGGKRAWLLRLWQREPHKLLTSALIGKLAAMVAFVTASALLGAHAFGGAWMLGVFGAFAVLVLGIAEIVPRSFAKTHAIHVAPRIFPVVALAYVVLFPVVWMLSRLSAVFMRMSGGTVTRTGPFVTEDDIVSMIELGSTAGVLDKQEGKMLASIIDLNQTLVREVMVPRTEISALALFATADEVLKEVKEKGHSRMPVFDDTLDEVKGFFHTKDLLNVMAEKRPFALRDHLRPVLFVPELMRVSDLLKLFQRKKTHLAVVVDEYGGTAGIVALEDVLEEIVGPIQDEHDDEHAPFKKIDDNRFVAEGGSGLYELGDVLNVVFPTDQGYDTLAGFLIARTGRMPLRGDRVLLQGWQFVVREADEKRVARVEIERSDLERGTLPPKDAAAELSEPMEPSPSNIHELADVHSDLDGSPNMVLDSQDTTIPPDEH